jgi:phosphoglucomutase
LKYGRNYYARYDYEEVDKPKAEEFMAHLVKNLDGWKGKKMSGKNSEGGEETFEIAGCDEFSYEDPVDGSKVSA